MSGWAHWGQNAAPPGAQGAARGTRPPAFRAPRFDDLLELAQLRVDALQLGCFRDQDLHPHVVANCHLIEQAAELGLHDREAFDQPVALRHQLGVSRRRTTSVLRRRRGSPATERRHGTEIESGSPCCDFT